ncbi:MAG: serine hydroxymethyltransferase [Nitrospirota bacterium]|nr:serine hydroxymethyltransferase [Nitrospirota bacterium]
MNLQQADPEIYQAIEAERLRETEKVILIASENYSSQATLEAQGSLLTNKYAEGYPGKRYYGGCEHVDVCERLAIERACAIFGADHANVQPHSGSQANMAVYLAVLSAGDMILGMNLAHGGHLTHGSPVNFSGQLYKTAFYGVQRETGRIDYAEVERIAREVRPRMLVVGASAYSRTIDFERMAAIARSVGAFSLADIAHIAGPVAAGLHPSPVPHFDFVTTTTHKTLRGPRGGMIMCREEFAKAVDKAVFPGMQGGPLMHVIAAKAVALREAQQPGFADYQRQVLANARAMADEMVRLGYDVVSGGTDNHLFLVDLTRKDVTGKDAEKALDAAGITLNKNGVPFDTRSPFVTSGIRIGTPIITTRGMGEAESKQIAGLIHRVLERWDDAGRLAEVNRDVRALCSRFPGPG